MLLVIILTKVVKQTMNITNLPNIRLLPLNSLSPKLPDPP